MSCFVCYDDLENGRLMKFFSETGKTDKPNVILKADSSESVHGR